MKKLAVLDLYSGFGGLSLGLEMTGAFEVIGGIDNYEWAVKTFYHNHPKLKLKRLSQPCDMSNLTTAEVVKDMGRSPDLIVGGPPCQGFSNAGKRYSDFRTDPRNEQVFHYLRFVKELKPKAFLMENVAGIRSTGQERKNELIDHLIKEFEKAGYVVSWRVVNASDYRVPQHRKRFMLVGCLKGKKFEFPEPPTADVNLWTSEQKNTVADALSDLPSPTLDEPQPYEREPQTGLQRFLRGKSKGLHNHLVTKHSTVMTEKLIAQEQGARLYPNWNHSWVRLHPNKPSPTVKENHRAPFVHHLEPRATSPRECARLQTVPDEFVFLGTKTAQLILIGNAVPAILAAHIGTAIARQIFGLEPPIAWDVENNPLAVGLNEVIAA